MIRAATVEDAEAIARVHLAAWADTYAEIVPPEFLSRWTLADRTARWRRILSGDPPNPHRAEVAVLDLGGALVGFASWGEQRDDALRERGFSGEISAIYLLARVQRRGYGTAMMARAAKGLLQRGHSSAGLWVTQDNLRARAFDERLGESFAESSRTTWPASRSRRWLMAGPTSRTWRPKGTGLPRPADRTRQA
jgi:GNAT superfamily N-acetyltransferase